MANCLTLQMCYMRGSKLISGSKLLIFTYTVIKDLLPGSRDENNLCNIADAVTAYLTVNMSCCVDF